MLFLRCRKNGNAPYHSPRTSTIFLQTFSTQEDLARGIVAVHRLLSIFDDLHALNTCRSVGFLNLPPFLRYVHRSSLISTLRSTHGTRCAYEADSEQIAAFTVCRTGMGLEILYSGRSSRDSGKEGSECWQDGEDRGEFYVD